MKKIIFQIISILSDEKHRMRATYNLKSNSQQDEAILTFLLSFSPVAILKDRPFFINITVFSPRLKETGYLF